MEQIFHHSECPGIHHTSGHPAHMASLPPAPGRREITVRRLRSFAKYKQKEQYFNSFDSTEDFHLMLD